MSSNRYDSTRSWYAIHTYSGYEEKVAESIRQRINGVDMADKIFDVMVPKEKQIQIKNGKRKVVDAKIFQGYVLVEMKLTDETWYIVRNTPGVTGFVDGKRGVAVRAFDFVHGGFPLYLKRVILAERSSEKVLVKLAALVLAKPLRVFRRSRCFIVD